MGLEIEPATEEDIDTWNRAVERSPQANLFHQYEALAVQAEHADAICHRLIGYKGQEVVGLFPLFEVQKGPFTAVFSPPPELRISYLGPALVNMEGLKQRKLERRQRAFIDGCFEWLDAELGPRYAHVRLHGHYEDLRPFIWRDCDVTPSYTYHVDLRADEEEILMRFSSDARSNIRDGREAAVTIEEGGPEAIDAIIEQVSQRYENQGIAYHVTEGFVHDLAESLPEGQIRPYTLSIDDEFIGGILSLEYDDIAYRWQGGVRTDTDVDLSVNDLLDWAVMRSAKSRGCAVYDLVGADNPRINRYKAKFNPELVPFYSIEWGSPTANLLAHVYQRLRQRA
ncbi:GNAT family N-acetyltransferase [Salinigranum marinum]|uniref:lipid II:glycine glycyltransferase FemX n=1 Tax=Salinigranum marinum TaxID=1515595 RepID=UPI002989F7E2|nr:GNAT family N-acetyltransferase [Salinigranum marinum]